jgi:hypothetical protein
MKDLPLPQRISFLVGFTTINLACTKWLDALKVFCWLDFGGCSFCNDMSGSIFFVVSLRLWKMSFDECGMLMHCLFAGDSILVYLLSTLQ